MDKKRAEHVLDNGVKILGEVLPLKTYLFFPVLYSICVWAIRRVFDLKERILAWQVWLDPDMVKNKPDAFILNFFEGHKEIAAVFAQEIQNGDRAALRKAFAGLYPVCGLEDAFLIALFKDELEAGEYRKIAAEFDERTRRAIDDIKPAETDSTFWKEMQSLGLEMASLGIHVLSDAQVRKIILDRIRKRCRKND